MPLVLQRRAVLIGLMCGIMYGLLARFITVVRPNSIAPFFVVMTAGFLFGVPFAMGYLTVLPVERPSASFAIFAPWLVSTIVVLVAALVGWEGAICIVMALPVMWVISSFGGLVARGVVNRKGPMLPVILLLPYAVMPLEASHVPPRRIVETTTEITIAAPADVVWRHVVSVDSIRPEEVRPALFTAIGFPRPVSAQLTGEGVGAVRDARFERGIRFVETVTDWEVNRQLSFTIRPDAIPASTLDPHVTIGGPYFDVLTGKYTLVSQGANQVRLILRSEHRVSTDFNVYSGWWANRIMRSVQDNILEVLKARCEKAAAAPHV